MSEATVAIIPARGGSKRIPRKNIREFCGRPMVEWSIKAAKESGLFERIIVSTDDEEVARIATHAGADVPFLRSTALSDDHTPTISVIQDAIRFLEASGSRLDRICCLYATAPFVTASALRSGYELIDSHPDCEFVISATEYMFPIWRSLKIDSLGAVSMNWPEYESSRSQDLEVAYHDAGQFYWGTREAYIKNTGFFSANCRLSLLPSSRVQDIDTEDDWRRAELLFQMLNTK